MGLEHDGCCRPEQLVNIGPDLVEQRHPGALAAIESRDQTVLRLSRCSMYSVTLAAGSVIQGRGLDRSASAPGRGLWGFSESM